MGEDTVQVCNYNKYDTYALSDWPAVLMKYPIKYKFIKNFNNKLVTNTQKIQIHHSNHLMMKILRKLWDYILE